MRARSLLLVLVLLVVFTGVARAEEPEGGVSAAVLEEWIQESPAALGSLLLLKYGMAVVGLILLVRIWIRRDRVRAGILPGTAKVEPTTPFELPTALALLGGTLILIVLASQSVASLDLGDSARMAVGMGVLQTILLILAAVIILRRRQLQAGPHTSQPATAWAAFRTFAIATACVIPVMFLSAAVLHALEIPITLYGPVEEVVAGRDASMPWIILVLSVVAAPIAEESLFRGMLYPAIRKALGPRSGVLVGAVVTSALFALIHWHAASFLPLFTLAMVFALVFERTDSLATVIGAHALWNAATMVPLLIRATA